MSNAKISLLMLLFASCTFNNKTFTRSEFLITNNTPQEIDVYSSAIVHYQSGPEERSLQDNVMPGEVQSLRLIDVSDSFDIEDVFTKLEIFQKGRKSLKPVMDKTTWKRIRTDNLVIYTLEVDSTFFK
jgi:hypothetical protein